MGWIILLLILLPFISLDAFFTLMMAVCGVGLLICLLLGSWLYAILFFILYIVACLFTGALEISS